MKAAEGELPVSFATDQATVRETAFGAMKVSHVWARAGARAPLRNPDAPCPHPHWGYVLTGRMHVRWPDGEEEILGAGDAFHLPAGHTALFLADTHYVEFTPV